MDLAHLKPAENSTRPRRRRGRGPGSGLGKTAGRGHKGWHSRSGSKHPVYYEGGQMPLQRRIPKRGFSNARFRTEVQIINVGRLDGLALSKVDMETLYTKGVIKNKNVKLKILGDGEISKALEVSAHAFSESAREKIESAGGKAIQL